LPVSWSWVGRWWWELLLAVRGADGGTPMSGTASSSIVRLSKHLVESFRSGVRTGLVACAIMIRDPSAPDVSDFKERPPVAAP
jgi:hypothetical protein